MKQNMNPVLVMTLLPCLCSATKQHCNGCLKKKIQKICLWCQRHQKKTDGSSTKQSARHCATSYSNDTYFPEVTRVRVCEEHKISMCPVCNSDDYARRRIYNVIASTHKSLNIKKTRSYLEYLGADSWSQVLSHLVLKREAWKLWIVYTQMFPWH